MIYLKVLDADGNFVSAEAIETPNIGVQGVQTR